MASSLNRNTISGNSIINVISTDKFGEYPPELQQKILDSLENGNQRAGGFVGKFFGNKKEIASMNIAAVICVLLIVICGIDILHSVFTDAELHMDLMSTIIPVVSLSLGFIFGKGGKAE